MFRIVTVRGAQTLLSLRDYLASGVRTAFVEFDWQGESVHGR